ncbi:MAG: DUF87 domain-containing protein [Candidatus Micrarchaeota archaeon]
MPGISIVNSKSSKSVGSKDPVLRIGVWGAVFVFLLVMSLLSSSLSIMLHLSCCSVGFFYSIPVAFLLTFGLWIVWNLLLFFWPVSGLEIGKMLGTYKLHVDAGWGFERYLLPNRKAALNLTASSPHVLVVGGSQTGKSVTIKTILLKLLKEKEKGNIIFDYHGEYSFLSDRGFTVVDAQEYAPLAQNYENEPFENIVSDFVEAFLVAFETSGDVQLAILKKQLEEKQDIQAAFSSIDADAKSSRSYTEKDRLSGLSLRLEKIARYAGGKQTLHELTKDSRNVVFDFSGIRDRDAADFYAENILRRYMALLIEAGHSTNIIIDEAHRLNTKALAQKGVETTTMRLARESGKFNGRLLIASQNLSDFSPGFSANFGNIICFRIPAGTDMQILEHLTGIGLGMLQSVMNGLQKGQALLIGPHNHYSVIKVSLHENFPSPKPRMPSAKTTERTSVVEDQEVPSPEPQSVTPRIPRDEEVLNLLKEKGALTATGISRRTNYPKSAIWRHLQSLTKSGKVIRYEEIETPRGMEVFYELVDPHLQESSFHRILIAKAHEELERIGKVKVLGGWNNPDLVFNDTIAIEVESGLKPALDGFGEQIHKRFEQGYMSVVVVVTNQKQKTRYEKVLSKVENVDVMKLTELGRYCQKLIDNP